MHALDQKKLLCTLLSQALLKPVNISEIIAIGGGSISSTYKLQSSAGLFFLKVNNGINASAMFNTEAHGLEILNKESQFTIPNVIIRHSEGSSAFLLMEFIVSSNRSSGYWEDLGIKLAELHKRTHVKFGNTEDNFIGSLPQQNDYADDWPSFFSSRRILPMVKMARDKGLIADQIAADIEMVLGSITSLMPKEPPALVHGDLWSGNLMVDSQGLPCLVDPAVYYGHREMDIAFSHLFGGFSESFYETYQEIYPLEPGFEQRLDLYNLYPLLVHLNLFGTSYLSQILRIIARFT